MFEIRECPILKEIDRLKFEPAVLAEIRTERGGAEIIYRWGRKLSADGVELELIADDATF